MKTCTNCGATLNDTDTFCTSCGASLPATYLPNNQPKTPISVGGWIGRSLIPLIPFVGGIIYLVMLFIWAGDSKKEDSFRNWAKAQLILTVIGIVVGIILGVIFGVAIAEIMESYYYYF